MPTTRRGFLKLSGAGLTALMLPMGLARVARASATGPSALVVLYQRGGCDGLNLVAPQGDSFYYTLRPNIANGFTSDAGRVLSQSYALDQASLGGGLANDFFALHPSMADVHPLYAQGDLAVVHATGRTESYSHFTAQDRMEAGDPNGLHPAGWLNRAVWQLASAETADPETLTGVAFDSTGIEALKGPQGGRTLSLDDINRFTLSARLAPERRTHLPNLYANLASGGAARRTAQDLQSDSAIGLFASLDALGLLPDTPAGPVLDAYDAVGNAGFSRQLRDAARLIKGDLGVRVIGLNIGGWDHHDNIINYMNLRGGQLGRGLSAFYQDLGDCANHTVTLVMTEFGRTAWENGGVGDATSGTDHGWGTTMLAVGGPVTGGRVLCRALESDGDKVGWPGLAPGQLHVNGNQAVPAKDQPPAGQPQYAPGERDLEVTIDFRDVFADVIQNHLGLSAGEVYSGIPGDETSVIPYDPDYTPTPLPDGGLFA